jgi:hypothetical protein
MPRPITRIPNEKSPNPKAAFRQRPLTKAKNPQAIMMKPETN